MICPKCQTTKTVVVNSRPRTRDASTWRRRHCSACDTTFTTEELPVLDRHTEVLSSDGSQSQAFSIGRLTLSVAKAFVHDPDKGSLAAYELARTIEQQLVVSSDPITTTAIYSIAQQTLQRFNKTAAAVYAAQHGVELT